MNVSRRVVASTLLVLAGLIGGVVTVYGDKPKPADDKASPDQEAVHKLLESFVNAFQVFLRSPASPIVVHGILNDLDQQRARMCDVA